MLGRNIMVFKDNLVLAVLVNNRILREIDGVVYLPKNTEYAIRIKNLSSKKSVVDVSIDGKSIGNRVIVEKNSSIDLERFDINNISGGKFLFIEKNDAVIEHRGDHIDDGIIRVEYWFEKDDPIDIYYTYYHNPYYNDCDFWYHPIYRKQPVYDPNPVVFYSSSNSCTSEIEASRSSELFNSDGITIPGNNSNQRFSYGTTKPLEEISHVLTLKLSCGKFVEHVEPLYVDTKIKCKGCGRSLSSGDKFCSVCGAVVTR